MIRLRFPDGQTLSIGRPIQAKVSPYSSGEVTFVMPRGPCVIEGEPETACLADALAVVESMHGRPSEEAAGLLKKLKRRLAEFNAHDGAFPKAPPSRSSHPEQSG